MRYYHWVLKKDKPGDRPIVIPLYDFQAQTLATLFPDDILSEVE